MCTESKTPEIDKVTPEMIEAGVDALRLLDWEIDTRREIVKRVLLAALCRKDH